MKQAIVTKKAPAALGPYSQAVKANGFVFCSGQIALKADGTFVDGNVKAQTTQVMENLGYVLDAAGCSFGDVVSATIYLTNLADFAAVNDVYGSHFKNDPPARATVEVKGLPKGAKVEIALIAATKP